jgi:hypothetical protein
MSTEIQEATFELLTKAAEIAKAEEHLQQRFREAASWQGSKRLGFQGGNMVMEVWWVEDAGVWLASKRLAGAVSGARRRGTARQDHRAGGQELRTETRQGARAPCRRGDAGGL